MSTGFAPLDNFKDQIRIAHGCFRDVKINLYAVVRDEMFFMPAFLHHYRGLGVEQFVILDDGSTDGTKELLAAQPDCVVLSSPLSFGDKVKITYPDGKNGKKRWGLVAKNLIPRTFFLGKYAVYVDADEFLILPHSLNLPEVFDILESEGVNNVAASLIDFFPEHLVDLDDDASPESFADLVSLYPYLDTEQLLTIRKGEWTEGAAVTATSRLLAEYKIGSNVKKSGWRSLFRPKEKPVKTSSAARKTPIARWSADAWLRNSHEMNIPPTPDAYLALAHFKFTHAFRDRVDKALKWGSYSKNSQKYVLFDQLLKKIEQSGGSLVGPDSARFEGADQLERLEMMKWSFRALHA